MLLSCIMSESLLLDINNKQNYEMCQYANVYPIFNINTHIIIQHICRDSFEQVVMIVQGSNNDILNLNIIKLAVMIKKLPQNVINEIAAGEVIQRPFNVIKQLVQNSIDAGATQINIHIQQGGLQLIKISDNGKGILVQDFPLLCARFATSKIQNFNDMKSLNSFGFRGQALASLSYVSNLTIASKYKQQIIGHSAQFQNQQIQGKILDIPMNTGTTITSKELFLNSQSRRSSLNPMEEKKKIYKLLCHFCLHYPKILFTLMTEKGDETLPSSKSLSINQAKMQIFQKITKLSYDKFSYVAPSKVANVAEVQAIITKINSCKGKTLMLNINNRIVQNPDLFKIVEKVYSECYQSIHQQIQSFWVYMSLKVQPGRIDCNVHPTKKAIGLFAGQQIYQSIKQLVLDQIKKDSAIKIIKPSIQVHLQKNRTIQDLIKQKMSISTLKDYNGTQSQSDQTKSKIVYAFEKNRTDSKQMPLQYYSQPVKFDNSEKKNQFFSYQFQKGEKNNELKKFFGECSYVGCYGLNYVLVHFQNKLFMLNIVPFIPAFLHSFCRNSQLALKNVQIEIDVLQQIRIFLAETKLLPDSIKVQQWISQQQNKKIIDKLFSIKINKDNKLVSYPCLGDVFIQCLDQDLQIGHQISYLICRVYNAHMSSKLTKKLQDKFFHQFISAQFIQNSKKLSPFNQKINSLFKNKVIPTLKTSPTLIEKQTDPKNYMKQMLDLKDVYKVFERC